MEYFTPASRDESSILTVSLTGDIDRLYFPFKVEPTQHAGSFNLYMCYSFQLIVYRESGK